MNRSISDRVNYWQLMRHVDEPGSKEPEKRPVCTAHPHCKGCPYPAHGFVCWDNEDHCMKKDLHRIYEKEEIKDERNK